ncbi:MAG: hypothetical protein MZV64_62725 [Ignavibacteriales bacterium]|nr:hypothetical protein [Ignavibacteriales bacterium]
MEAPKYAFIGVRACELKRDPDTGRDLHETRFHRPGLSRPGEGGSLSSRSTAPTPAETCFCTSMGTGPRVKEEFDLNLTELDDVFVLTIGSELARRLMTGIPFEDASGYVTHQCRTQTEPCRTANAPKIGHDRPARANPRPPGSSLLERGWETMPELRKLYPGLPNLLLLGCDR